MVLVLEGEGFEREGLVWGVDREGERERAEERRWDSVRRRWRARSAVKREDSVGSAEGAAVGLDFAARRRAGGDRRGRVGVCR